ncbi:mechanosensitive ion channel protein MscS [Photobacterium aphoticum]|uniref:Mechanosensitive ion channel protein MscS n=1 Tax=Photobacterium aphoticum TaxID=754436 RepID=A0A0J1GRH4_9GAMM|nr:mechanosensitive ion channel protein MscS [Photobacterium aphoticum]
MLLITSLTFFALSVATSPFVLAAELPDSRYVDAEISRLSADDPPDTDLIGKYQALSQQLKTIQTLTDEQAQLKAEIRQYPQRQEALNTQIQQVRSLDLFNITSLRGYDDLSRRLAGLRAAVSDWRATVKTNADSLKQLEASRLTLPKEIAALNSQIDDVVLSNNGDKNALPQWLALANRQHLMLEKGLLTLKQQSLDAREAVLKLEQQLLSTRIQLASPIRITLQNRLAQVEQDSARALIEQATELESLYGGDGSGDASGEGSEGTETGSDMDADTGKDIASSQKLAKELEHVLVDIEKTRRKSQQFEMERQLLSDEQRLIKDNLAWLRQSTAFGASLRAQLQRLPQRIGDTNVPDAIAQSHIRIYEISQMRTRIATEQATSPVPTEAALAADPQLNARYHVHTFRGQLLVRLGEEYDKLIVELGRLQVVKTLYQGEIDKERAFLREQQLWIRSNPPLWRSYAVWQATDWTAVGDRLKAAFSAVPEAQRFVGVGAVLLYSLGSWLLYVMLAKKKRIHNEATKKVLGHPLKDRFGYTIRLVVLSMVQALILPAWFMLITLGLHWWWPESIASDLSTLVLASAFGLFVLELIYQLTRRDGVLNLHLNWPTPITTYLHRSIRHLRWVFVMLLWFIFAAELLSGQSAPEFSRLLFLLLVTGMLYIYGLLLRHKRLPAVMPPPFNHRWALWGIQLLLVGSLLAMIVIAAMGYYLAAWILLTYQQASLFIMLGALLAYQLGERWFKLEHRQLNYQRLLAKREELIAQQREQAEQDPELAELREELPEVEESGLDVEQISEQSLTLLRGLCVIGFVIAMLTLWSSALEMARWLERVVLWQVSEMGDGGIVVVDVTLQSVVYALIVVMVTVIAVRNLPGLLELLVLRRLELAPGTGYAITTLIRYLLVMVGVLSACSIVGVQWSKLQWLVAAFGVGLGFGLQEIFANFISGLIILFERPIRIGDIVTINDLSGTVSKIKTRATTIIDWDNKEIVVPNKAFLTEKLINWSLTDPITRIVIPIGVAYGSDVDKVEALLYQVANEHPLVLKEPSPTVFFLAFGGSSLDFEMRVYITAIDYRLSTIHLINKHIDALFREHGIEIAFPQMDIHVRDVPSDMRPTPPLTE